MDDGLTERLGLKIPEEWEHLPEIQLDTSDPDFNRNLMPFEEAEVEFSDSYGKKERVYAIGRQGIQLWYGENINSETGLIDEAVNAFNDQVTSYRPLR